MNLEEGLQKGIDICQQIFKVYIGYEYKRLYIWTGF